MNSSNTKKLVLVIGATGAQGIAVINALLAPASDGTPSPYTIRALTRDTSGHRAQALTNRGVELIQGRFDDFAVVRTALSGCYGAWINTDGFTVGEKLEIFAGMRIFELAKQERICHYVWSSLDYSLKEGGYSEDYKVDHYNGKARVAEWMQIQPSIVNDGDMSWSIVTSGPYMEMLNMMMMFGPMNKRKDGTFVFASPIGNGHVPMIALEDLGFFARYTFDHRSELSGKNLKVASDIVGWDYLVSTFTKVTGQPAIYKHMSLDEWWSHKIDCDKPLAKDMKPGEGVTTIRANFSSFWRQWRDDIIKRDLNWIKSIHPNTKSLETWMRETGYAGGAVAGDERGRSVLKNVQEGKSWRDDIEKNKKL